MKYAVGERLQAAPPLGEQRRNLMLLIICANQPCFAMQSATSTASV
jgi:hypothetical protein